MKKYLILTSIFALAACGGGGGGHSGSGGVPTRAAVTQGAIDSNSHITSMASEVLIPKGSGAVIARSGSVNYNGETYTSYRLDDVNFRVATGGGNDAFLNFSMDSNGRIDSLVLDTGEGKQKMFRRDDVSADFRGIVYEYVLLDETATQDDDITKSDRDTLVRLVYSEDNDPTSYSTLQAAAAGKCPDDGHCRWDRIDQAFRVSSENEEGFRYSDFGKLQTANFGKYKGVTEENFADAKTHTRDYDGELGEVTGTASTWDDITFDEYDYDVFGGGYKVSALQHRPTTDMHFTGKAVGSVYATNSANHNKANVALVDDSATLDFVGGTETLNMHFDNWYDVTVTKNNSGNRIQFSDFDGTSGDNGNEFRKAESLDVSNFTTTTGNAHEPDGVRREGMLDMGYYGATGPEEATGVVRFKETANEGGTQYEREFRAGYGMTPDPE